MHISTSLIKETTKFFYYFYITRIHAYANQPERKLCTHEISLFKSKSFKRRTDRIQSCSQYDYNVYSGMYFSRYY